MRTNLLACLATLSLAVPLAPVGCSSSTEPAKSDAAVDAAGPPPDMANGTAMTLRYVSNKIILPKDKMTYTSDPTGSGKFVNAFGSIVQTLTGGFNVPLQQNEDTNINNGKGLVLVSFTVADPTLNNDPAAAARVYIAASQPAPDFSGLGKFTVDTMVPGGKLPGALVGGTFQSDDPLHLTNPPTVYLQIVLYKDIAVDMPVVGARITFTPSTTGLASGILTGGMRETDIQSILIPAITKMLDTIAHEMPCNPNSNCDQVKKFFDTNHDGTISLDEVQNNQIIQGLLAPDVQLYDATGAWHPNPMNTNKDSISVGAGFEAVTASFTE